MTKEMMIDLETLGNSANAPIIQIGAVMSTGEEFKETISFSDALKYGKPDGDTIDWWMSQSDGARGSVTCGAKILSEVLVAFKEFVRQAQPDSFWAHATFDFPVLDSAYRALEIDNPIKFWKTRDLRTIQHFYGDDIAWEAREGNHHDALDDAKYQMVHLQKMLKANKQ